MYLDEVEKYFIKKRKKSLIISPVDWTLIEKWYNIGIPLRIVKQGIDTSLENFFTRHKNDGRTLNTIKYCEPAVIELWQEYKENMIGESKTSQKFDECGYTLEKLKELKQNLRNSAEYLKSIQEKQVVGLLRVLYKQINDIEKNLKQDKIIVIDIEDKLHSLNQKLIKDAKQFVPSEILKKIEEEAKEKLKKHKNKMSQDAYSKTLDNIINKKIEEYFKLPDMLM
ncbi:hypothetical protein HY745_01965 [Candidatus Desantisbacteria bacterium]|nr:hypothetical protein [Candidatus Desantisbacteria bacterium]